MTVFDKVGALAGFIAVCGVAGHRHDGWPVLLMLVVAYLCGIIHGKPTGESHAGR